MGNLNYLKDEDLEFLSSCTNDELEVLVNIITKDKDGVLRDSEDLTLQPQYKKHFPNHQAYWKLIAADLQYFGGNTIANSYRGHGVCYQEILTDVCKSMKLNPKPTVNLMERDLLEKFYDSMLEQMSPEEVEALLKTAGLPTQGLSKQVMVLALQAAVRAGGFASYQIAVIVVNSIAKTLIGRGLALGANAALTRGIAVAAGPIGVIITAVWTGITLAGPAYRVTVPSTIYIALLRKLKETNLCIHCSHPVDASAKFCPGCGQPQA
jgi:uncharacterized protein YaaW (UPF0174 family)